MKYIWFDLKTGEFSNPFSEEDVKTYFSESDLEEANKDGWKLIKFDCVNDKDFEFYNRMKIVTNEK